MDIDDNQTPLKLYKYLHKSDTQVTEVHVYCYYITPVGGPVHVVHTKTNDLRQVLWQACVRLLYLFRTAISLFHGGIECE